MTPRLIMDASLLESLLPTDAGVRIRDIRFLQSNLVVELETCRETAACPCCRHESSTVRSRYQRTLQDQPCLGHPLTFHLTVRRFVCVRDSCSRKIFCERVAGLADVRSRTSLEVTAAHRSIGFALGGEAGARLAKQLAVPTSPDTLLRRVKTAAEIPAPPPRYVGVDDWAFRKGHSYATILIDLERGTVIDLLDGRDGEALKTWLAANPQVEVISRDRWSAYREAARAAAPQAKQVADRFHLLRNVREAVEKLLSRHAGEIRAASDAEPENASGENSTPPVSEAPNSTERPPVESGTLAAPPDDPKSAKRRAREERFRLVKELHAQGHSMRSIARQLGLNWKVVRRYLREERCPDWNRGATRATGLDSYASFIGEWIAAGHRNSADLFRQLRERGYRGGYDAVRRALNKRIGVSGQPGRRPGPACPPRPKVPSARKLSFRLVKPKPESRSGRVLQRLRRDHPRLQGSLELLDELIEMLRRKRSGTLTDWTARAEADGEPDLRNLAKSLLQDAEAVEAALKEDWSNGPVEGQVNRLKTIKRQMYGRAGLKLLKARVKQKAC